MFKNEQENEFVFEVYPNTQITSSLQILPASDSLKPFNSLEYVGEEYLVFKRVWQHF